MWLWQRPGFEQQLLKGLQRQQNRGLFCDMLLQADGISVPAHSCVLAALSPALAQVLCSGPVPPPGQRRLLELQGVRAGPLLRLVGFLYSGQLQGERPAEREELTLAAVHLGIEGLLGESGGEEVEGEKSVEREEEDRGEREDMLTADRPTQTDNPRAPPPAVRTSSLPVIVRLTPPRPPVSPTPCPAVPLEGSDDCFTLSSSAVPGLAGISQIRSASAAVSAQAALTAPLSDDVMTAPPPAGLTVPAPALGSVAASLADSSPANPAILLKSGGGATLNGGIRARQNFCGDGTDQGGTCFLGPRAIRGGRTRKMRHGRMKSRGGGARQQDQRISIKIRLKRRCKGELWEIVSVLEEGVACGHRVGPSIGRGRSLRHRQNLPTLSRITRCKRLRQQWPSRGAILPQRIHGTRPLPLAPSLMSPPPSPDKPRPLPPTKPAHNPAPLPQAPSLPDDSDEQIEKLLNDIMMGLDMLETGASSQGDGESLDLMGRGSFPCPQRPDVNDGASRPENQAQCGVLSGPPPINHQSKCTCSQETTLPRVPQQASEELHILDHFLRSRGGQVGGVLEGAAHGHCVGGGDVSTADARRKNCDPQPSVTVATSVISQGSSDLAAQVRGAAVRLCQASSPWRELRIPEFLSPPPPITPGLKELQLPHCLSPLSPKNNVSNSAPPGPSPSSLAPQALVLTTSALPLPIVAQPLSSPPPSVLAPPPSDLPHSVTPPLAQHLLGPPHSCPPPAALATPPGAPPPPAASPSAPPLLATPSIPPWLCPFPVPLNSLSSSLPDRLQLPLCHGPTRSRRGQSSCFERHGEMGAAGGEKEEGRTLKTVTRQPVDGGTKQKRRRGVKEREEEIGGKRARPTLPCRNVQRSGICGVGRGRGVARTPRSAMNCPLRHFEAAFTKPFTSTDAVHSANVCTKKTRSTTLTRRNTNVCTQSTTLDGHNANVCSQKTQGTSRNGHDANLNAQKTQSLSFNMCNANVCMQNTQGSTVAGCNANVSTQKTQSSTLAGSNASIDTQKIRSTTLDRLKAKVCIQKTQGSTLAVCNANIHTQKAQSTTLAGLNANVNTQKTQSSTLASSNASIDAQKIRSRTLTRLKAKVCTQKTQGSTIAERDTNVHTQKTQSTTIAGLNANVNTQKTQSSTLECDAIVGTQKTQSATLVGCNANVCTQRTQDTAVCSENTRHSNRSAGRSRRRCICTEDVKRTMLCASRLKRSAVCGSFAQMRGVGVAKEGAGQQEGVCLQEEKPTLSRAVVRLAAAACPRSKRPVKQSRGRPPMRRSVQKNGGQTSVLDQLESSGPASTLASTESRGEASIVAPTGCGEQASTVAQAGSDQPAAVSPSAGPVGLGCILAPASSCEETGECRRAPPKTRMSSMPGRQELLRRTLRSRACRLGESLLPSTGSDTQAEEGRKGGTREEGDLKNVVERMGEVEGGVEMVQLGTVVLDGVMETEERREEGVKRMGTAEGVENTGTGRRERRKTDGGKAENSEEIVAMELGEKDQEGGATDDLATPTAVGAEDQAMPTVDMEDEQVTSKNVQVTEQATPTPQLMCAADASMHSKSICDVITTDSSMVRGEREEAHVTGEEERTEGSAVEGMRDGRGEEGGDSGQTDTWAPASGEVLVDVVMEDTATTEEVISEQREPCGEGSHAGSESRKPKTSLTQKHSDPCTESAKRRSLEQDEEEVEVDVLGCTSPAYLAIDLMLENMGAGLNDSGADLCDRESSEEEEEDVDVTGDIG